MIVFICDGIAESNSAPIFAVKLVVKVCRIKTTDYIRCVQTSLTIYVLQNRTKTPICHQHAAYWHVTASWVNSCSQITNVSRKIRPHCCRILPPKRKFKVHHVAQSLKMKTNPHRHLMVGQFILQPFQSFQWIINRWCIKLQGSKRTYWTAVISWVLTA